jgi:hypothetical protein
MASTNPAPGRRPQTEEKAKTSSAAPDVTLSYAPITVSMLANTRELRLPSAGAISPPVLMI